MESNMDKKRLLELAGVPMTESPNEIEAVELKDFKKKAEDSVYKLIQLEVQLRNRGHEKSSKSVDKAITHARAAKEALVKAIEDFEE